MRIDKVGFWWIYRHGFWEIVYLSNLNYEHSIYAVGLNGISEKRLEIEKAIYLGLRPPEADSLVI